MDKIDWQMPVEEIRLDDDDDAENNYYNTNNNNKQPYH
jgi:hypothetical protein